MCGDGGDAGGGAGDGWGGDIPGVGFVAVLPVKGSKSLGDLIARKPYTTDELFVSISNAIKQHRDTARSHDNIYWRIVNLFIGKPNPEFIEVDGMRLRQLYELFDTTDPVKIQVGKIYKIRLVELERIVNAAMTTMSTLQN